MSLLKIPCSRDKEHDILVQSLAITFLAAEIFRGKARSETLIRQYISQSTSPALATTCGSASFFTSQKVL
jgi:hypothetical protein